MASLLKLEELAPPIYGSRGNPGNRKNRCACAPVVHCEMSGEVGASVGTGYRARREQQQFAEVTLVEGQFVDEERPAHAILNPFPWLKMT